MLFFGHKKINPDKWKNSHDVLTPLNCYFDHVKENDVRMNEKYDNSIILKQSSYFFIFNYKSSIMSTFEYFCVFFFFFFFICEYHYYNALYPKVSNGMLDTYYYSRGIESETFLFPISLSAIGEKHKSKG